LRREAQKTPADANDVWSKAYAGLNRERGQ
jgi:hypothetical protein